MYACAENMKASRGRACRTQGGYILLEALVSLAVLSIGIFTIQGAMREAIIVRGMTRDYVEVRFLLEEMVAKLQIQPRLMEGASGGGAFPGELSRYRYTWSVTRVDIPLPPLPANATPEMRERYENFELPVKYLGKISVEVSWERSGEPHAEIMETLFSHKKLIMLSEEEEGSVPQP